MLLNYIKTGWRSLARQKVPTLINASGMALAVGCCIAVYCFFDLVLNADDFHPNADRIALLHRVLDNNGIPEEWAETPEALGPVLLTETPEIEQICRLNVHNALAREADGDVFSELVTFADTTFFDLFAFALQAGRKEDFRGRTSIVLSRNMAEKYFGTENPVGRTMSLRFNVKGQVFDNQYVVVGVARELPHKSSFGFNCLIPYEGLFQLGQPDFANWTRTVEATFVKMHAPDDLKKVHMAAQRMVAVQNEAVPEVLVKAFGTIPLCSITTQGARMKRSIFNSAVPESLMFLGGIAVIMLLLVCFNYINIAMASATGRLREISVRKVMGSARRQIIGQFLVENALVCFASLFGGLVLAQTVFMPWFKGILGMGKFPIDYADPLLWQFLALLFVVTVVGGSAYPAFYISSLQPVAIFKNKLQLGERNLLRRVLVGGQFLLTFIALFSASVMLYESPRLRSKDWGYRQDDVLVMRLPDAKALEAVKNEASRLPNTISVAGSGTGFGRGYNAVAVETEGKTLQINELVAGRGYLELVGVPVSAGRSFPAEGQGGSSDEVLVNTTFKRHLGWESIEGKTLRMGGQQYRITGETPDFYYDGFDEKIRPVVMRLPSEAEHRYVSVRVRPGTAAATMPALESLWKQHFPNDPAAISYQNTVFDGYFRGLDNITGLTTATAVLAILLSAFGIFGLIMLRMMRRVRELSIRRVLGAGTWHFGKIIGGEFVVLLLGASVLGSWLGFLMMVWVMDMFSPGYMISPTLPGIATFALLLLVVLGACGFHLWRVWMVNPVESLRSE